MRQEWGVSHGWVATRTLLGAFSLQFRKGLPVGAREESLDLLRVPGRGGLRAEIDGLFLRLPAQAAGRTRGQRSTQVTFVDKMGVVGSSPHRWRGQGRVASSVRYESAGEGSTLAKERGRSGMGAVKSSRFVRYATV